MPKWDGLKPLPDHVIAPLLRTLACIPRTADTRLLLVKRTDGRPPGWDRENDYDVVFRGRKVGRIWKYDYTGKVSGEMARWLWHWDWRDVDGRKDAQGHCGSLEAAMAQFRAAWDAPAGNVRSTSESSRGATSLRTIAAGLNVRGIPTARGNGPWPAVQVARVIERACQ